MHYIPSISYKGTTGSIDPFVGFILKTDKTEFHSHSFFIMYIKKLYNVHQKNYITKFPQALIHSNSRSIQSNISWKVWDTFIWNTSLCISVFHILTSSLELLGYKCAWHKGGGGQNCSKEGSNSFFSKIKVLNVQLPVDASTANKNVCQT